MHEREWRTLVENINADIAGIVRAGIVRAQQTLSEVNDALERRASNPIEEDFIVADMWGLDPHMPRITEVDGVSIQTRMLHRHGLRQKDVKGADLLYEIVGQKFALVQYKKANRQGRVERDEEQLDDLVKSCPNPCPPFKTGFAHTCGSWYAVRPDPPSESSYVPACIAAQVFGDADSRKKDSFRFGITVADFQRSFAYCLTGARIAPERIDRKTIEEHLFERDWVLFDALQFGSFGTRTRQ